MSDAPTTPFLGLPRPFLGVTVEETIADLRSALDTIDSWAQVTGGGGGGPPTVVSADTQYGDPWPTGADILLVDTTNSAAVTLPVGPPAGTQVGVMIVAFNDPSSDYYEVDAPAGVELDDLGAAGAKYWALLGQMVTFTYDGTQWWSSVSVGRMDQDDGFPEQLVAANPGVQIGLVYDASVRRVKWAVLGGGDGGGGALPAVAFPGNVGLSAAQCTDNNVIVLDTDVPAADIEVTLPDLTSFTEGSFLMVNAGDYDVNVTVVVGQTVNGVGFVFGVPTYVLPAGEEAVFMAHGTDWLVRKQIAPPSGGGGATTLDELDDVDTSGVSGWSVLYHDGSSWFAASFYDFINTIMSARLQDVFLEWQNVGPNDGEAIVWNAGVGEWTTTPKAAAPFLFHAGNPEGDPSIDQPSIIIMDCSDAPYTATLFATAAIGTVMTLKKVDATANVLTVATDSGTIDGAATYVVTTQYESVTVVFDGTDWWVI